MTSIQELLAWLEKIGAPVPPPLTWRPTYEPAYLELTLPDGSTVRYPLNDRQNVTAETAEHLRAIYDPRGTIEEAPFLGPGGPVSANPNIRWLVWPNKVTILAGALAAIFDSYPNDPATADKHVREIILSRGAV